MAQKEDEEDGLEACGNGHVHDELVGLDAATEGSLAAGFDGEGAELADIFDEEAGVNGGRDGVVGERSGEGSGGAEANGASGDGANDVAEVAYVIFILLVGDWQSVS